jgi:tetratricopeptide (TPR) repeat protein
MKGAQGKHKEALEYYNKALAYDVALKNDYMISVIYSNMGQAYLDLKDYKNAERATQEGIKHATIVDSKNDIMVNTSILALAYEGLGEKGKALSAYKLYMNLKDSLFNEEKVSEAAEKEMTFEFTKERLRDSIKNLDEQNLIKEKVKVKEAEIKQGKTIRFTLIGGLIMVVVFAFFFYNRFRVTQKQKKIIEKQKEEVHRQKEIIEEHQKETIDSINYAKRIQYALLAQDDLLSQYIPNHFVLFNPKDIVSGDFYWAAEHNQKFYLAVCDSTGHGVPGAFMSLLNMGFLSEAIKEKSIEEPHEVLNYVRRRLIDSIGNDGQKDGMDAILICVDRNSEIITYAAANNEPILIRENEVIALPKDRMPVGKGEKDNSFTLHTISAKSGDVLYLYTDGYADQFGGPKGKKYKYKQ